MKIRLFTLWLIILAALCGVGLADEMELQDGVIDLRAEQAAVRADHGTLVLDTEEELSVGDRVWLGESAYRVTGQSDDALVVEELLPAEYLESISIHQDDLVIASGEGTSSEIVSSAGVKVTANSIYVTQSNSFTVNFSIGGVDVTVPLNLDGKAGLDFEYNFLEQELKELRFTSDITVHGTVKIEAALKGSPDGFSVPIGRVIFYHNGVVTIGADVVVHITLSGEGLINYTASVYSNVTYDPVTGEPDHESGYDHDVSFEMHGKASFGSTVTPFLRILGFGEILTLPTNMTVTGTLDAYLDEKYQCADLKAWMNMSLKATITLFKISLGIDLFDVEIPILEKHLETNGAGKWLEVATCIRDLVPEKEKVYCTLTFDTDGGSPIAPMVVEKGMPIQDIPTPSKAGYRFGYWFGGDESSSFSPHLGIHSDMTIKAIWIPLGDPESPGDMPDKPETSGGQDVVYYLNYEESDDGAQYNTYFDQYFYINGSVIFKDIPSGVVTLPYDGCTVTGYYRQAAPITFDEEMNPLTWSYQYVTNQVTLNSLSVPYMETYMMGQKNKGLVLDVGSAHTVIVPSGMVMDEYIVRGANLQTVIVQSGATITRSYAFSDNPNLTTVILEEGSVCQGTGTFAYNPSLTTVIMEDGALIKSNYAFSHCSALTTVQLPADMTYLPYCAFEYCTALKAIDLPDSLTELLGGAFAECTSLESITIPENVTDIWASVFYNCKQLREVKFNDKLEYIGNSAFSHTALFEIDLPDSLTTLGSDTFSWCHNLREVDMPDSITKVDVGLFSCCENLERVKLPRNLGYVQTHMFSSCAKLKEIVWPEPTLIIGEWAFASSGFESLVVPDTVTKIYPYAFYHMTHLTTLELPPYVSYMGDYALGAYPLLEELVLPEGMTTIEYTWETVIQEMPSLRLLVLPSTFEYPDDFWNHPYDREYYDFEIIMRDGSTTIGSDAFVGENLLFRTLEIPATVEYIGSNSFRKMPLLSEVTLSSPQLELGAWSFCDNPSLNKVTILSRDLYPENCFNNCAEDLVIRAYRDSAAMDFAYDHDYTFEPIDDDQVLLRWTTDGVTFQSRMVTIGELITGMPTPAAAGKLFTGWYTNAACTQRWNFATDVVPETGVTLWAGWLISGHEDFLFRLEDDDTLTVIQCLTTEAAVEIPAQVGTRQVCGIAASAFNGALTQTLTVPASVTLESSAFLGASSLTEVNFAQGSNYTCTNGLILADAGKTLCFVLESARQQTMTLPEGIERICTAAFWGANAPTTLHLPATLTDVETLFLQNNETALYSAMHLETVSAYAQELDLKYNLYPVTYIHAGQTWLTDQAQAYIPLSTAVLPYEYGVRYAWYTDAEGTQLWTADALMPGAPLTLYACPAPLFATQENADGSLTITAYLGEATKTIVPDTLNSKPVTAIQAGAFATAAEIALPGSVTTIAQGAFAPGCVIIADQGSAAQLYADQYGLQFQVRLYELSFVTGSAHKDAIALPVGAELALEDAERYGYAFAGWYTDKALSQAAPAVMPAANLTLYAAWVASDEPLDYEIRIVPDGGVKLMRYLGSGGELSIPGSLDGRPVTSIADSAFSGCTELISVEVPDSVTSIGDYAFSGCTSLQVASLGRGVTEFPGSLFSGCSSLEAVLIWAENASVRNKLFYNWPTVYAPLNSQTITNLSKCNNYYDGITPAGRAIYMYVNTVNCVVDEPRQMYFVQYWPRNGGGDVVDWQFDPADSGESLGNNRFVARKLGKHILSGVVDGLTYRMQSVACYRQNKQLFTSYEEEPTELLLYYTTSDFDSDLLEVPSSVQDMPVTGIDSYALYGNDHLRTVILPDTISYIGDYAFAYCPYLNSILIPSSVTSFGNNVFYDSNNTTIYCYEGSAAHTYAQEEGHQFQLLSEQPYTYEVTEEGAVITGFDGFAPDVEVPAELDGYPVVGMGKAFFANQFIRHITLPEGMRFIEEGAFAQSSLSSITFPSTLETIGAEAFALTNFTSITIPSTVKNLGDRAFLACYELVEAHIGAQSIGSKIFEECYQLSSLTLLSGVKHIGGYAFQWIPLSSITLPDTVETIGDFAFESCELFEITFSSNLKEIGASAFKNNYLESIVLPGSVTTLGEYSFGNNILKSIVLPGSITTMGERAFYNNELTDVTLSYGLKEISAYAFAHNALESIVLPDSVTMLGEYAFAYNDLTDVTLSSGLTEISGYVFYNNSLESIVLPDSVTMLGEYAFAYNDLTDVTLSSGLTEIANYAFYNCSLQALDLPETVTMIGDSAFSYNSFSTLDLPASITMIGQSAFSGCQELTQLSVAAQNIGDDAFSSCSNLTSVYIAPTVQTVGNSAFYYMSSLTQATICAREIGEKAFAYCHSLTDVTFHGVCSIGERAFYDCAMTTLNLKFGLESIGDYAFYSDKLEEVTMPESIVDYGDYIFDDPLVYVIKGGEAEEYCTRYGYSCDYYTPEYLIVMNGEDGVMITGYNGTQTALTIPAELEGYPVTAIGPSAFINKGLTEVVVPATVKLIDNYAFANNEDLLSVQLSDGLETLGSYAFYSCYQLQTITLPKGLTTIGDHAFAYCVQLNSCSLPEGLTTIGVYAFSECSSLTVLTLPDSLTTIGAYAFESTGITSLTIPGSVKQIPSSILYDSAITHLVLEEGVESIASEAFYDAENLISVVLPSTITSIGDFAFSSCSMLQQINLPEGLTTLSRSLFSSCSSLKSITLPQSVTSIGSYAFAYSGLTDITLPEGLTDIGDHAFYDAELSSIKLPEGLTSIDDYAFMNTNLTELVLPENLTSVGNYIIPYDSAIVCEPGTQAYDYAITNNYPIKRCYNGQTTLFSLEISGESCQVTGYNGTNTSSLEIPSVICGYPVTAVKSLTLRDSNNGISEITIQEGVTELADGAFAHLDYLYSLYLPDSLVTIGTGIVTDFSSLYIYASPNSAAQAYAEANGANFRAINRVATEAELRWSVNDDNQSVTLTYYNGYARHVILPEKIGEYTVTALNGTFRNNANLLSVTMPDTVVTIGEDTFRYCENMTTVHLSEQLTTIGEYAFDECRSLAAINFPDSLISIGSYAFSDCTDLTYIHLPQGLTSIGNYAFSYCSALTEVHLPEGLTQLGNSIFTYCKKLTSVTLPQSLTTISYDVFSECTMLTRVYLPTQIEQINSGAFSSKTTLVAPSGTLTAATLEAMSRSYVQPTALKLPARTTEIAAESFQGSGAEMVIIPEGCTSIGDNAFADMPNLHYVQLPQGMTLPENAFDDVHQLFILEK